MTKQGRQAVLFYMDDYLSSTRVEAMTAEEERGYFRLLLHAAKQPDGGLPNDDRLLAGLSKLGAKWKSEAGRHVLQCFEVRDGRIYNARLEREIQNQERYHERRANTGRIGGLAAKAKREASGEQTSSKPSSKRVAMLLANGEQTSSKVGSKVLANGEQSGWQTPQQKVESSSSSSSSSSSKHSGLGGCSGFLEGEGGLVATARAENGAAAPPPPNPKTKPQTKENAEDFAVGFAEYARQKAAREAEEKAELDAQLKRRGRL